MMLRVREGHACKVWVTVAMWCACRSRSCRRPAALKGASATLILPLATANHTSSPPAVESRRSPLDASGMPLSMVPKKSVACATEPSHHAMGQRYG